jgi:hypothetical protein
MFRQINAIIRGVEVPWKLLRQDLYYGCVWITIRPVWLVVGRCSQACTRSRVETVISFTGGISVQRYNGGFLRNAGACLQNTQRHIPDEYKEP